MGGIGTRLKVGVVLSGCGFLDGSEIHEATLTLLFLDKSGAHAVCAAPFTEQKCVMDYITRTRTAEIRNVMSESARIARGSIRDIKDMREQELDALIFPGGGGAANNLSDFDERGAGCSVTPGAEKLIKDMHKAGKPMGFICIAPVLAAKVLGSFGPELTIGNDKDTANALVKMGARHKICKVDEIAVDIKNRLVSTPAYMLGPGISDVAIGVEKLVAKVLEIIPG